MWVESGGRFHDALTESFPHSLPASRVRMQAEKAVSTLTEIYFYMMLFFVV